jgi:ectoine hydroxylase-related dioxygenase (phytanoyl-CoA dioxygenase family)
MKVLDEARCEFFHRNGYLLLEQAVTPAQLAALQRDMQQWCEGSREHGDNYGETVNGKPRFDLDPSHSPQHPALRRVNAPVEVSAAHLEAATDSVMVDAVADLIGPDVKFHHSKTNSKQPHSVSAVRFHQDFPFTPHSNDDVVTALLMLDDVDENNGALEVVPGSHRGPIHSIWQDGRFTGYVAAEIEERAQAESVLVTGRAGDACLMHTRVLHGSAPNDSDRPRTLFICVYSAEDAVPLSPNPMPSRYEGRIVRGGRTGRVRCIDFQLALPQLPPGASFFEQQEAAAGA